MQPLVNGESADSSKAQGLQLAALSIPYLASLSPRQIDYSLHMQD